MGLTMEGQRKELPKATLDEQKRICEVCIILSSVAAYLV